MNPYIIPGVQGPVSLYTPDAILSMVSLQFGVPVDIITSARRTYNIANIRFAAAYFLYRFTNLPYKAVGAILWPQSKRQDGGAHDNAINGVMRFEEILDSRDPEYGDLQHKATLLAKHLTHQTITVAEYSGPECFDGL